MNKFYALFFLCILCPGLSVFGQQKKLQNALQAKDSVKVETLEQKIYRITRNYGLDVRLFQSLIYWESSYNIKAVSPKGAACYTQLMPGTARRFGLRVDSQIYERFNTEKCLTAGAQYLAWLLKAFRGDVRLALAGYNAGEGAVMKYGWRIPPFKETVQYVEKICALYYGQSGHGVTLAYNQPLAQSWINELYSKWKLGRIQNTGNVQPSYDNDLRIAQRGVKDNKQEQISPQTNENKKPVVTRVVLSEDTSPRIRTQSLSFR